MTLNMFKNLKKSRFPSKYTLDASYKYVDLNFYVRDPYIICNWIFLSRN